MNQWGFYFNQDRCLGCLACKMACKNWNEKRRGDALINVMDIASYAVDMGMKEKEPTYIDPATGANNYQEFRKFYAKEDWRRVESYETGASKLDKNTNCFEVSTDRRYISVSCNHCDDPACVKACPMGAIYKKSAYGAVLVNFGNCISCGKCKDACPWSAPQFYDNNFASFSENDPKRPKMTKCTLCVDRIGEGLKPACVAACWNRALDADTISELKKRYPDAQVSLPEFKDGENTGPNILFKRKSSRIK